MEHLRKGEYRASGNGDEEAALRRPPHPRPLSLKGRGEKYLVGMGLVMPRDNIATLQRFGIMPPVTQRHSDLGHFLPSPLEGEGSGVRGTNTKIERYTLALRT
jgi:hypothetical protein